MKPAAAVAAVLFDLDGTLVDTAPDLIGTLQALRSRRGLSPLPEPSLRHQASRGALGLLEAGFADQPGLDWQALRPEFLEHYANNLWVRSRPFAGIEAVLDGLADAGLVTAVVTNKPGFLTEPLLQAAGWSQRFACVISGDTVARSKPAPDPVLAACHRVGRDPGQCLFVGDDERDVTAGRAAGTLTSVARWGYLPPGLDSTLWGADWQFEQPEQITSLLLSEILE